MATGLSNTSLYDPEDPSSYDLVESMFKVRNANFEGKKESIIDIYFILSHKIY